MYGDLVKLLRVETTEKMITMSMGNKNKCGDCAHFDEDEAWSEDDYWWFNFCDIGKNDQLQDFYEDTVACDCFKPIPQQPKEKT